ncbi:MAG: hypothetical protein JRI55_27275 [Deltaproteobacteria bacterium]|jgi:V/A-type H+-transporting ATPase subunit E|nr:hypothetical protein [Deltaproteobacteria bacterium]
MGDSALQQVIEELKSRGLRAGEDEGAKLVADAEAKADKIVADAKAEADKIVADAKGEAGSLKKQLEAELRQAAAVGLQDFRSRVEKSLLVPAVEEGLGGALKDAAVLRDILQETVKGFAASAGARTELEVLLPEAMQGQLDSSVAMRLKAATGAGVTVKYDTGFELGLKISPKGSGYLFDFSDEGFKEIFLKFLAPRFRQYFFAGE